MRYLKTILSSLGLLLVSSATAMAMMVQDPPIKVDVSTSEGSTTWYAVRNGSRLSALRCC